MSIAACPPSRTGERPAPCAADRCALRCALGPIAFVLALPLLVYAIFPVHASFVLKGCPNGYVRLAGGWHYVTWNPWIGAKLNFDPIDCDAATFRSLESENGPFAVDRLGAFCRHERIPGADPATFEPLSEAHLDGFSRDARHVYSRTAIVEQADPQSFRHHSDGYNRDATRLYHHDRLIAGADPDTWTPLANSRYAVDREHVFLCDRLIPLAEPRSFSFITDADGWCTGYSRDAQHVFYQHTVVADADPATFRRLDTDRPPAFWQMAERDNVLHGDRVVSDAEPATFEVRPWKN